MVVALSQHIYFPCLFLGLDLQRISSHTSQHISGATADTHSSWNQMQTTRWPEFRWSIQVRISEYIWTNLFHQNILTVRSEKNTHEESYSRFNDHSNRFWLWFSSLWLNSPTSFVFKFAHLISSGMSCMLRNCRDLSEECSRDFKVSFMKKRTKWLDLFSESCHVSSISVH